MLIGHFKLEYCFLEGSRTQSDFAWQKGGGGPDTPKFKWHYLGIAPKKNFMMN